MGNLIKRNKFFLLLFLVELVLFWTNYKPGTYLVGWDNVFPELNFQANFERNIFSIWQEYRGLGVVDGMAHAALLPHTLAILLLSLLLPTNLLRYFFQFLLHFVGGIGMYLILRRFGLREWLSFFGALFYQFNLFTVQMFYAPLEVFSYHFAFLPLLIYLAMIFLEKGGRKNLLLFAFVSWISLPQAHVPPVFLAYLLLLLAVLVSYLFFHRREVGGWRRPFLVILAVVMINASWGFPYVYTALKDAKTIVNSKINQMSTDNVVLRNKAFGNFTDVVLLRGFMLDYVDYQVNNQNDYLMRPWKDYLKKTPALIISFFFFLFSFLGLVKAVNQRQKKYYPFAVLLVFTFLLLADNIPVVSLFFLFMQKSVPLFYNAFRFTFTKFSILFVFCYTIFLCFGLETIFRDKLERKIFKWVVLAGIFLSLFVYTFPSFQGNFIYKNLKMAIPQSYFDLINFFKSQDTSERIAVLPQPTYWGWVYYQWGVRGSGFQWYGLSQPSLDGAFYPWSEQNENYYWEIAQAIYSNNRVLFEKVLEKYQVHWLVIDESIISPFSPKALYLDRLEGFISQSSSITNMATFDSIKVYRVNRLAAANDFVFLTQNLPYVGPTYAWNNFDQAFSDLGNYFSTLGSNSSTLIPDIYYPYRSLFTARRQEELEFGVQDRGEYFAFFNNLPKELVGAKMIVPKIENLEAVEIDPNDLTKMSFKYPQIYLDGERLAVDPNDQTSQIVDLPHFDQGLLEIRIPKFWGLMSYDSNQSDEMFEKEPQDCEKLGKGIYTQSVVREEKDKFLRLSSVNSSNCLDFDYPNLTQKMSYLITVESRNIEGTPLLFGVANKASSRTDLETYLPRKTARNISYFIIPPMEDYGLGYSLHFNNASIGEVKSVNDLGRMTINSFPYHFLSSLKIVKNQEIAGSIVANDLVVEHPNPPSYWVSFSCASDNGSMVLVLSQSFAEGWKAYLSKKDNWLNKFFPFVFGKEIKDHFLVNNWENGWQIPTTDCQQPTTVYLFFWPQLLEYLGLSFLLVTPLAIWKLEAISKPCS